MDETEPYRSVKLMGMDSGVDCAVGLSAFDWHGANDELRAATEAGMQLHRLARGREATLLVGGEPPAVVVKVWPPGVKTAERQLEFLRAMDGVLPVPAGLGWGTDGAGRQALAMRYAGDRAFGTGPAEISELARTLARVHQTPTPAGLPADRSHGAILDRLFPQREGDLVEIARALAERLPTLEGTLVHGDFHPGNVVASNRLESWGTNKTAVITVIDWTEARDSDWRFDLAWALTLLTIYYPAGLTDIFLDAYSRLATLPDADVLDAFVMIVGLHWMHLARTAPVPINEEWWMRAERLVRQRMRRLPPLPDALARLESLRLRPRRSQR